MNNTIDITFEQIPAEKEDFYRSTCEKIFDFLKLSDKELSVVFCNNSFIQDLNRQYRGKDSATDVLSFPMDENNLLGDIVISIEYAAKSAADIGHSADDETAFLLIHGILHLLGYDHETEEDEEKMTAKQREIKSFLMK